MKFESPGYEAYSLFQAELRGEKITFISKPGLPDWSHIAPGEALLAERVHLNPYENVLYYGIHHGALAALLAPQVAPHTLMLRDTSHIAIECSRKTLRANGIENASFWLDVLTGDRNKILPDKPGEKPNEFDSILMQIPKGRKLARRWLSESHEYLKTKGTLYLVGANDQGIKSIIQDGEDLFGSASILGYKKSHRIAMFSKPEVPLEKPAWAEAPGISPGTWIQYQVTLSGISLTIHSLPGVFSADRLDEGTEFLLSAWKLPISARILDVGCGSGVIGLAAAQSVGASGQVDMIDENIWAVQAAQKNIIQNQMLNSRAFSSDLLQNVQPPYDYIITNPPFHAGKKVNYDITQALIHQAHQALSVSGKLIMVANQFIRYDRIMETIFKEVRVIARNNKYYVVQAIK